ncbi:hypothetical protein ADN00_00775 [Ornatilinea apprima]|uniref:Fructosamine kinase n=1 Tax=Ornatilinea apprima TaxID=1134406 RepID=A0A0P6XML6_9CHLR|nr:fructosamine kinase family protein [Ornatilinea apprima]KPL81092.1 hypothetical protein ADN00_00775 [Ornatilinea apprima]
MSDFPVPLEDRIREALQRCGDFSAWKSLVRVGGGCISQSARLDTEEAVYFVKWNPRPFPKMFQIEAESLAYLASTHSVNVPKVYAWGEKEGALPGFLLVEWVGGAAGGGVGHHHRLLGEQLAVLHRCTSEKYGNRFGLWYDNYIGSNPQLNTWSGSWVDFFRDCRLKPQFDLAVRQGRMPGKRKRLLEKGMDHLDQFLGGRDIQPSLLHGDLWGGNFIVGINDQPYLIDPAIFFGDREADLAFTELFGGFSRDFYDAYQTAWPLDPQYAERKSIYNLYHLLNHLNLFGESYGSSVDAILSHFFGN